MWKQIRGIVLSNQTDHIHYTTTDNDSILPCTVFSVPKDERGKFQFISPFHDYKFRYLHVHVQHGDVILPNSTVEWTVPEMSCLVCIFETFHRLLYGTKMNSDFPTEIVKTAATFVEVNNNTNFSNFTQANP